MLILWVWIGLLVAAMVITITTEVPGDGEE